MSWEFSTTTEPKAKKEYTCESWIWLSNCNYKEFSYLTFSERKAIVKAKQNKFKIMKGDRYIKVTGKWEGEFYTFRAIPELNDICHKYNIYED